MATGRGGDRNFELISYKMSIVVKIGGLPEIAELENMWHDLECRSRARFFVTWSWIGVWLANLPQAWPLRLMRAERDGRIVGLGILAGGESKKICNVPYCDTEHLHETGVRELDMVIEHNDFLLEASSEDEIRSAMISQWLKQVRRVSELSVPGTSRGEWLSDAIDPGKYGMQRFDMTMKSHAMDLGEVKRSGGDPVSLLDAKTRAKIRRAMREYSALGELCVETSSSVVQGLEWLDSLEMLHQKRWVAKGEPGCFSNPRFIRFHRMMIARNHGNGRTIVMRVSVGDAALGYLYGFADKERFYLYQCGFDYDMVDRNSMPGLVCHILAMQELADRGLKLYDFMAGCSGYKSALSNVEESMTWTIFRSHSVRLSLIERVNPVLAKMRCHKKRLIKAFESIRTRTALLATPSNTAKQGI
jgi:hypothetical protein